MKSFIIHLRYSDCLIHIYTPKIYILNEIFVLTIPKNNHKHKDLTINESFTKIFRMLPSLTITKYHHVHLHCRPTQTAMHFSTLSHHQDRLTTSSNHRVNSFLRRPNNIRLCHQLSLMLQNQYTRNR